MLMLHAGAEQTGSTLVKGPRTRAAIIGAASEAFTVGGYESTTLDQIAAKVDITRGTVLFHFATKRALLLAVVDPLFQDMDTLLSEFERYPVPLTPRRRRALLTRYCDTLIEHRFATILLVRDLTTIVQMHWPTAEGPEVTFRMMALLQGHHPDRALKLRAAATIGAILRPVCMPPIHPDTFDAEARQVIVESALAAYRS